MPAVADRFYPGKPEQLRSAMDIFIPAVAEEEKVSALAVVMPHAGYVYSGATAGATISRIRVPQTALILGPNHHGRGAALALGTEDWSMPLGTVPVDRKLAAAILQRSPAISEDQEAHLLEHSLEVQVPFLQWVQPALRIVPLVVSQISYAQCQTVAHALAQAISESQQPVLMVASTDMSHYESRQQASVKDGLAIERILALDPQGLYATVLGQQISMCGIFPTTIVLLAALELGATRAELVRYTDSGDASGDTSQVVGYAGLIIS
jgi:AmmeMemoRadiSam system protein B